MPTIDLWNPTSKEISVYRDVVFIDKNMKTVQQKEEDNIEIIEEKKKENEEERQKDEMKINQRTV